MLLFYKPCVFLKEYAEKIAQALIQKKSFETPATIGIFAAWGSGKTQFINLIREC